MLMCRSLAVPKVVQNLARGICMDESSRWESLSGEGNVCLQAPELGTEVPSPGSECRPSKVAGAQGRAGNRSSRAFGVWEEIRRVLLFWRCIARNNGARFGRVGLAGDKDKGGNSVLLQPFLEVLSELQVNFLMHLAVLV